MVTNFTPNNDTESRQSLEFPQGGMGETAETGEAVQAGEEDYFLQMFNSEAFDFDFDNLERYIPGLGNMF